MFRWFRDTAAKQRKFEDALYEAVAKEIASGVKKEGLWAKALAEAEGNDTKAKAIYMRFRVQSMKDEIGLFESFKKEVESAARREEKQRAKHPQSEPYIGPSSSNTADTEMKWECSKCNGPLGVNYGSAQEFLCKKCASKSL